MSAEWVGSPPQYGLQRASTYTPDKWEWGVSIGTTHLMHPDQAREMAQDLIELAGLADLRNGRSAPADSAIKYARVLITDGSEVVLFSDQYNADIIIEDGQVVKNRFGKVTEE
ncbi:hypothetical protein SEA_KOGUMA_262 [Mycobacterium phage Koguma]|uniref:Uncharacterized protein n=1 Tax=Mycobacterium phage Nappy TaxID=1088866 RepID=G8IE71_9CAUD|nr:hypothetical protein NAPPY_262 [Mycobacterium phage Nappy]AER26054.1 hypothetical protein NAPPY_262 [Mycobacterium phage Nappy]ATN90190.1 hypothetical protein SEA_KOGUMA_262 [Mycobacterium phage Koguma]QDP44582.1 hypothetical protein SEA_GRUNGLE_245 [Mycobacterium phage Grungle]